MIARACTVIVFDFRPPFVSRCTFFLEWSEWLQQLLHQFVEGFVVLLQVTMAWKVPIRRRSPSWNLTLVIFTQSRDIIALLWSLFYFMFLFTSFCVFFALTKPKFYTGYLEFWGLYTVCTCTCIFVYGFQLNMLYDCMYRFMWIVILYI